MPLPRMPSCAPLKRRIVVILLLVAALVLAVLLFLTADDGPIGLARYNRIQGGMSKDEVLAIIGLPPGNHSTDFYTSVSVEQSSESKEGVVGEVCWISNTGMITVGLDDQERVRWKSFHRLETQGSWQVKLRSWWWAVRKSF
jgi:hypothetical protein